MSIFDKREKAAETELVIDAQKQFRIDARRNKLLGAWVADKLGLAGEAKENYALEVVKSDMEEIGEEDVFRKVKADLDAAEINVSDDEIREKMQSFMAEAKQQILDKD